MSGHLARPQGQRGGDNGYRQGYWKGNQRSACQNDFAFGVAIDEAISKAEQLSSKRAPMSISYGLPLSSRAKGSFLSYTSSERPLGSCHDRAREDLTQARPPYTSLVSCSPPNVRFGAGPLSSLPRGASVAPPRNTTTKHPCNEGQYKSDKFDLRRAPRHQQQSQSYRTVPSQSQQALHALPSPPLHRCNEPQSPPPAYSSRPPYNERPFARAKDFRSEGQKSAANQRRAVNEAETMMVEVEREVYGRAQETIHRGAPVIQQRSEISRKKGPNPVILGAPEKSKDRVNRRCGRPRHLKAHTQDPFKLEEERGASSNTSKAKRNHRLKLGDVDPAKGQFVYRKHRIQVPFEGRLSEPCPSLSDEDEEEDKLREGQGWDEEEYDNDLWNHSPVAEDHSMDRPYGWAEDSEDKKETVGHENEESDDFPRLQVSTIRPETWKILMGKKMAPRVRLQNQNPRIPTLPLELIEKILIELADFGSKSAVTALQICKSSRSLILPYVFRHLAFRTSQSAEAFHSLRRKAPLPPNTVKSVAFNVVDQSSYRILDLLKSCHNRPKTIHADGILLNPNRGSDRSFYTTTGTLLSSVQELTVVNHGLGQKWINELVMPSEEAPQSPSTIHDASPVETSLDDRSGNAWSETGSAVGSPVSYISDNNFSPVNLRSVTLFQPNIRRCTIAPEYLPQLERVSLFITSDGVKSDAGLQLLPDIWRCISSGDSRIRRRGVCKPFDVSITFVTHKRWDVCRHEIYAALIQLQEYLWEASGSNFVVADADLRLSFHVARFHSRQEVLQQVMRYDESITRWQQEQALRWHTMPTVTVHPNVDFTSDQRLIVEDDFRRRLFSPLMRMSALSLSH